MKGVELVKKTVKVNRMGVSPGRSSPSVADRIQNVIPFRHSKSRGAEEGAILESDNMEDWVFYEEEDDVRPQNIEDMAICSRHSSDPLKAAALEAGSQEDAEETEEGDVLSVADWTEKLKGETVEWYDMDWVRKEPLTLGKANKWWAQVQKYMENQEQKDLQRGIEPWMAVVSEEGDFCDLCDTAPDIHWPRKVLQGRQKYYCDRYPWMSFSYENDAYGNPGVQVNNPW